jgi:hypothetical protein
MSQWIRTVEYAFISTQTLVYFSFIIDLYVDCNDTSLNRNRYQVSEQTLSFESPMRINGKNDLQIIIYKKNINSLTKEKLFEHTFPYIIHGILSFFRMRKINFNFYL